MHHPRTWNHTDPCARQPCDSERSWQYFQQWLGHSDPRPDWHAFARTIRQPIPWLVETAELGYWQARADWYDAQMARRRYELSMAAQVQAADVAIQARSSAELLRRIGTVGVQHLIRMASEAPDFAAVTPELAVKCLHLAEKITKDTLTLQPVATPANTGGGLEKLSAAELWQYRQLQAKIEGAV